jgi:inner membrane protein
MIPASWGVAGRALACAAALLTILSIDRWLAADERSLIATGILDEIAHLLTAILLICAFPARLPPGFVVGAMAGAVLIDLDHLPLMLGSDLLTRDTHRPLTHGLLAIVVVLGMAGIVPARWRWIGVGLAVGFSIHFWRDLATSTAGVPLLWPWRSTGYLTPYPLYVGSLVACAALVVMRGPRFAMPSRK